MEAFLLDIFGDAISAERRLVIFTTPDKHARLFISAEEAVRHARSRSATQNVYFGLSLVRGAPRGRGKVDDAAAIGALWADIDVASDVHRRTDLPASVDQARTLLAALPLRPSYLVHSGHGLHAYWLLKEPWTFDAPEERQRAAAVAKGWHGAVCAAAAARGWHLENLGDLTRVLRLPGTLNHNGAGAAVTVRVLECQRDLRYAPGDFEPYLVRVLESPRAVDVGELTLSPDTEPPALKLAEALVECPQFRQTWERQRADLPDQSQSGYDLSLATIAALRGWTDQEIADLIIAARRRHGQNPAKALRADYVRRTIARARAAAASAPAEGDIDLSALVAAGPDERPRPRPGPSDPGPFPERLLAVPGFIADVMRYNLATATRPQPVLALTAAIGLQAVLAARKVRDARGNRTNLYCVGVADSGAGKDHARKVNKNILFQAGLNDLEGNEDLASDAGLVAAVEHQPAILFQLDEFGRFLRTIGDPKRAPHLFNVLGALMKLFSSADTVFRGKAYADRKRNKIVDQPCVSLYGTTVPEHFFESLTGDSLNDGFIARLLVFEAEATPPRQRAAERPVPQPILEAARWWGDFQPGGNLRNEHPEPLIVPCTDEANGHFDRLAATVDAELARPDGDGRSLWARAEEKACRLALVYACSADRQRPCIDADAARWACALADHLTRRMLFIAHEWIADGQFDARQKKVLRIIRQAGGQIGRRELSRRTQSLTQRERQEVIDNLIETDQIEVVVTPTATKPKVSYALR